MGDALQTVTDRVGVVVKRINAPFVLGVGVRCVSNSVYHWVTQGRVHMGVVDLGSE